MLLLEQDIIKKKRIDKNLIKFKTSSNKKYQIKGIWNSIVYTKKWVVGNLPDFYNLIF